MNVCLVNVPNLNLLDPNYDPPLGLMYLASMLELEDFDVAIEHLGFYDRSKWVEKLEGYDAYGFTVYTPNVNEIARLITKLKNGKAKFIAGGPHATSLPEETLKLGFDTVVVGEGEYIFPKILKRIELPRIIGKRKIGDLDTLPYPARHLVPLREFNRTLSGVKSTPIIAGRGCPHKCAFCSKDVHGNLRLRSPSNVIGEIEEIHSVYDFQALQFYDGTFTARPFSQLEQICRSMESLGIIYRCTGDLRRDNTRVLQLLYDTGCRKYSVGVESGSQKVLNAIRKGTTVERNLEVIREARDIGLKVKVFIMVGCPGETRETVQETIDFIEKCGVGEYDCYSFIPYPDCDIYKHPENYGIRIKSRNFDDYCVIAGHGEGRFVVETKELTTNEISKLYGRVRETVTKWNESP